MAYNNILVGIIKHLFCSFVRVIALDYHVNLNSIWQHVAIITQCPRCFKGVLSSVPTHGFLQTLHINNSLYTNYENVFIELDS